MGPLCIALVSAILFMSINGQCTNPRVRKEWRSLCDDERASWIKAVNVSILIVYALWLLADLDNSSVLLACPMIQISLPLLILRFP